MSTRFKANKNSTKNEIVKSDFWINFQLPTGKIGFQLARGLKDHNCILDVIDEVGIEALNELYELEGSNCYIVKASTADNKADDIIAKIKAMKEVK